MKSKIKSLSTVQLVLLAIGTLTPCAAAVMYAVLQLEQPKGLEIKKLSLLFAALALPVYLIVLLLWESIDVSRDRKKITAMVTELTENLSTHEVSIPGQGPAQSPEKKSDRIRSADALVRKIVQMINA